MRLESERPWERMIRDLHRGFTQLDSQIELLRDIDQTILEHGRNGGQRSLEQLFLESLSTFSEIHYTDAPVLCYVDLGTEFALLYEDGTTPAYPLRIPISPAFDPFVKFSGSARLVDPLFLPHCDDQLFQEFKGTRSILLCPMYSSSGDLLCVVILIDPAPPEGSRLKDPDFVRSIGSLIQQLAIAYANFDRGRLHQRIQSLWDTFLGLELSPTACFEHLAENVPSFLPKFGPMKFAGKKPQVQVLTLVREPESETPLHLVIRGTTGREHEGTRIALDDSICGMLVEDKTLPFFCDDPTKHASRYKNYLGKDNAIHTELAVRLTSNEYLVGVLNLESEIPDAFNKHHVNAMLHLSTTIAPIVSVFERRLAMNTLMQASVTSSTARYLKGLAGVFRHASETPLLDFSSNIELATNLLGEDIKNQLRRVETAVAAGKKIELSSALGAIDGKIDKTQMALSRLGAVLSQISTFTHDFISDIDSYAQSGPTNLRDLLGSAVALANAAIIAKSGKNIRIVFAKDTTPEPIVFCSTLLKQHLFSILHNAVLSIQERLETDPSPGVITVSIFKFTPPEFQEVTLNESWAIRIKDNGSGVTADQLAKLRRFTPGVRFRGSRGTGHGLTAAQRYLASIDGRVDLDGLPMEFFEVILHFPVLHESKTSADPVKDQPHP